MKIVIFGLAITSSWGNGHATTYRALARALHLRGHRIVFFEQDAEWYASNCDLPEPGFCLVRKYSDWQSVRALVRRELADADVAVIGSYFPNAEQALQEICAADCVRAFYDIDTPVTLSQLYEHGRAAYLRAEDIPLYDIYFSFTGGPVLQELEERFHARRAVPLYCSVDTEKYSPLSPDAHFACDLSYMGTYAPDRQPKVEEMLCGPARAYPAKSFVVAGPQFPSQTAWPENVRRMEHLAPEFHPRLYSSSRLVLNLTRRDMMMAGYSPSVRLFEAAACGAAIVSDVWPGLDSFFSLGTEILPAAGREDVARYLTGLDEAEAGGIGQRARARVLAEHSSSIRAAQFETFAKTARQPKSAAGALGPVLAAHPAQGSRI